MANNSVDFEPVQQETAMSTDSRDLAHYEEYCRRELPRLFRANIEEILCREMQQIAEPLLQNLDNIFRDCQDRMYRSYLESTRRGQEAETDQNTSTSTSSDIQTQELHDEQDLATIHHSGSWGSDFLEAILQRPPSISDLSRAMEVEESTMDLARSHCPLSVNSGIISDSGYASEKICDRTATSGCPTTDASSHDHTLKDEYSVGNMKLGNEKFDWQDFNIDFSLDVLFDGQ
jgi:hypothetical protein